MKKGEFLQFLNHSSFLEKKSGTPQTGEALSAGSVAANYLSQGLEVENVKPSRTRIRKRFARSDSSAAVNEPCCGEVQVIRRPDTVNVKVIDHITDDVRQSLLGCDKSKQMCTLSEECGDSIIYDPSAFSTTQV